MTSPLRLGYSAPDRVRHQNADTLSQMPCAGDCKQCRKLIELTREVRREPPEGRGPPLDYSDQPVIVNLVEVVEKNTQGWKRRVARWKQQDEAVMAELPRLWDIDDVAVATRADPILEKLLAWKSRPQWEQIVREGPELNFYWQHCNLWRTDPPRIDLVPLGG